MVRRGWVAILAQQGHQDPREALDSLASKANWEMWVSLASKGMLDLKENQVPLVLKECWDPRVRRGSGDPGETLGPKVHLVLLERGELLATEDSLVLMDCLDPRVL